MAKAKRIMRTFKLKEISMVDKPAQEGALAVLIKRDPSTPHEHPNAVAKDGYVFTPMMTTAEEGHQHIVCVPDDQSSGYTDAACKSEDNPNGYYHSHPWIKADGVIAIGEADGHSHQMMAAADVAAAATTTTEEDMTTTAKAAEVQKSEVDDVVVYTTTDGAEIRKSHGDVALALAKRSDEQSKQLADMAKRQAESDAKIRKADLTKRAGDLFKNLPGTADDHGTMLGALEAIEDEAVRKSAIAAVKAGSDAMASAFKRAGSNDAESNGTTRQVFESELKKFAVEKGMSTLQATPIFIKTSHGEGLYRAYTDETARA